MNLSHTRKTRARGLLGPALGVSLAVALLIAVPVPQAIAQETGSEVVVPDATEAVGSAQNAEGVESPESAGTLEDDTAPIASEPGPEQGNADSPRHPESALRAGESDERLSPPVDPAYAIQFEMYQSTLVAASGDTAQALMRLTDADGNPVAGETVTFASDDEAQLIGDVTDHGDGRYSATVTSSDAVGVALLTASVTSVTPEVTAGATLTQTLGLPAAATTEIELSNASIEADGAAQTELTVRVRDAQQRALPGARISVASSDAGQVLGALQESEPGVFVASVRASHTVGSSTLTVTTQDLMDDAILPPPNWWTDADGGATEDSPAVAGDQGPDFGTLGTIELAQFAVQPPTTTPPTSPPATPPASHPTELAKTGGAPAGLPLGIASALLIAGVFALSPLRRRSLGR